jgi:hypothetical protein
MWIVAIAWMYVATMMTVAEAASPQGSILAAVGIFFFYGLFPTALVMYVLGAPGRRRARQARENQNTTEHGKDDSALAETDASGLSTRDTISSERKEDGRI